MVMVRGVSSSRLLPLTRDFSTEEVQSKKPKLDVESRDVINILNAKSSHDWQVKEVGVSLPSWGCGLVLWFSGIWSDVL